MNNATAPWLRPGLVIAAIVDLVYGLGFLLVPDTVWKLGAVATTGAAGSYRWTGAWLLGMGLGSALAVRAPDHQGPLFAASAAASGLAGLALIWWWATDYDGATWFILVAVVLTLAFCAFFVRARAAVR